jgi:hypothetical protein
MARLRPSLDRLLAKLPDLGDILRGSLLHRKTFHSQGCAKCARGACHPQWVLNVNYPGGQNRQISLHRHQLREFDSGGVQGTHQVNRAERYSR